MVKVIIFTSFFRNYVNNGKHWNSLSSKIAPLSHFLERSPRPCCGGSALISHFGLGDLWYGFFDICSDLFYAIFALTLNRIFNLAAPSLLSILTELDGRWLLNRLYYTGNWSPVYVTKEDPKIGRRKRQKTPNLIRAITGEGVW